MKDINKYILTATLLTGLAAPSLCAEEDRQARALHAKTKEGVTVTIEKIAVERILNEAAWVGAYVQGGKDPKLKKAKAELAQRLLPVKRITCFASVLGDVTVYGPAKIVFANEKVESAGGGTASASPPKWQRRLPNLAVHPEAAGIAVWMTVSAKTPMSDLFPARIEVSVTKSDGEKLTFVFEDVGF